MRVRGGSRPAGNRLRRPTNIQIKGQTVVPQPLGGDINATLWTTWPWTAWIKPQIDLAVTLGANTLALKGGPCGALNSGAVTQAQVRTRMQQFLDYCASVGIYVYGHVGQGEGGTAAHAANVAFQAGVLKDYTNVIGIDVWNEINVFNVPADPVAAAQTVLAAARAVTSMPLTVSVSEPFANSGASTLLMNLAPYVDFLDVHPYSSPSPNWSFWEAQPWWKDFIVGECGKAVSDGSSAQTEMYEGLATYYARPKCFGVVAFCVVDYETSAHYGMYDTLGGSPRTQITVPYATWPKHA